MDTKIEVTTEPNFRAQLVCWNCGATRDVMTHGPAQFAFDVVNWAEHVGMKGWLDRAHGRVLVFCDANCARQQMTKDGRFRLRPKRTANAAKEV